MANCTADSMNFGRLGRRIIEVNFQGDAISSDGGLMLLRQVDQRIGLSKAVADWESELEAAYPQSHGKQRMIREFRPPSWKTEPRLVTRLEFGSQGRIRASWSPTSNDRRRFTTNYIAGAAKPKTGSRKPYRICSAPEPVVIRSWPTGCGCCSMTRHRCRTALVFQPVAKTR